MLHPVILLLAIICTAIAQRPFRPVPVAPQTPGRQVNIISETNDVGIDGSYRWSFEADNGISAQESGQLKNANSQDPIEEAQGSFQYTAPDGTPIQLQYIANEGGFQPQGNHLPVAPPIPPEILKALEWNAAHPEEEREEISRPVTGFRGKFAVITTRVNCLCARVGFRVIDNMSKISLIFLAVVLVSTCAQRRPPVQIQPGQIIKIIRQESDIGPDGSYQWSYETENGISAQEQGRLKNPDTMEAQGQFSFTADDGTPIQLQYTANEDGFQPQGAHLPTPPPIPAAILRALEYNAAHPEQDEERPRPVGRRRR
ncbi:uncharacterized protein LOC132697141 [Cylas formicarius]|uniref:uncharacterized protein LOC132697141 n=1 Tax=Cylas formicarius TaxID=197179 RepID=UPI002958CFA0|nr:uncharacterized protein LOC132697141 [Cylas formicarius]